MILHLPTFLLLIGFPVFWLEMYLTSPSPGRTSLMAFLLALIAAGTLLWRESGWITAGGAQLRSDWRALPRFSKILFTPALILAAIILLIAAIASFYPPHLMPEFDVLNYHYTLPRQHLIRHSFAHIPWSSADLWTFPVQFGLSPYWFATELPNKIPQFFFTLSVWLLTFRLAYRLAGEKNRLTAGLLALLAVAGSHGFAIQYGTAMMDIPNAYLLIAAFDSFLDRRYVLAGAELAFYMWAKAFLPVQFALVFGAAVLIIWLAGRMGWQTQWTFAGGRLERSGWLRTILFSILIGIFVGLPFCLKSLYYAGTPAYPVKVGMIPIRAPETRERQAELERRARQTIETAKAGGAERSVKGFVTHFWDLAVPSNGVNNAFDYPAGLPYLLFFGPFVVYGFLALKKKQLPVLPLFAVLLWGFWWLSTHHMRFLYAPLVFIFVSLATLETMQKSKGLLFALLLSVALTTLSVFRSHQADFGKNRLEVLRSLDRELINYDVALDDNQRPVEWNEKEVAFATFPVNIRRGDVFILE